MFNLRFLVVNLSAENEKVKLALFAGLRFRYFLHVPKKRLAHITNLKQGLFLTSNFQVV